VNANSTTVSLQADKSLPARIRGLTQEQIVLFLVLLVFGAYAILLDGFFTVGNMFALARSIAVLGILALGMSIVIIARGIDLSQIAVMASTTGVAIILMNNGVPIPVAMLAGIVLAAAIGAVNGFLIAYCEIPSLIGTLASSMVILGVTRGVAMPQWQAFVSPENAAFLKLGANLSSGLPAPFLVFVLLAIMVHVFLSMTTVGRFIYAHGDNPDAARLTGLPVRPLAMLEYALCSAIACVAGLVSAASTSFIHLRVANGTLIFDVVLVAVLGGVSLVGGRGSVVSVIVGTLLIGILLNGMTILNLDAETQDIIKGAVLIAAIIVDSLLHPRDDETAKQGD
jgi:ribose transport system permease protein